MVGGDDETAMPIRRNTPPAMVIPLLQSERIGGHWPSLASARRDDKAIAAFLELHVEQGSVLESRGEHRCGDGVVGSDASASGSRAKPTMPAPPPYLRQDAR